MDACDGHYFTGSYSIPTCFIGLRASQAGIQMMASISGPDAPFSQLETHQLPISNLHPAALQYNRPRTPAQYYQDTMPMPASARLIQLKGITEIFVALILTVNPQLIYDSPVTHKLSRLSGLVSLLLSFPFP